MLVSTQGKQSPDPLLLGISISALTISIILDDYKKLKLDLPYGPVRVFFGIYQRTLSQHTTLIVAQLCTIYVYIFMSVSMLGVQVCPALLGIRRQPQVSILNSTPSSDRIFLLCFLLHEPGYLANLF